MTKHTPGPWIVSRGANCDPFSIEAEEFTVAHVKQVNRRENKHHTKGNARLIASAPDLLEALKLAANEINDLNHVLHTNGEFVNHTIERGFRRIIAKATGEEKE